MTVHIPQVSQPVCVLGMHRSGTSLIAGTLHLLGVFLGPAERLDGGSHLHVEGYWEHKELVGINVKLMHKLGGRWDRPPYLGPGWDQGRDVPRMEAHARAVITRDFADVAIWGWKDPRTCITLPFWRRVVPEPRYVVCLRDPAEVTASIAARDGLPPVKGVYLWLRYTAEALRQSNGRTREFIVYEDFLVDPVAGVDRLRNVAGTDSAAHASGASLDLRRFIDPALRHHRASDVDLRADGAGDRTMRALAVARELYAAVRHGRPPDTAETSRALQEGLRLLEPELAQAQRDERRNPRRSAERLAAEIDTRVPEGEAVVLIDDGAILAGLKSTRRVVPFLDQDGMGMRRPEHDQAAIEEVERLRESGVRFVVIAWPARWWLEHYSGLRAYMQRSWRVIGDSDRAIFFEALS